MPDTHVIPQPAAQPRAFLEYLYNAAVIRALPLHNTAQFLPPPPDRSSGGRTVVLGAGKAGGSMAQAVEALWPLDAPLEGLVVTRYHHTPPRPAGQPQRIEVVEASHPVPDAAGMAAAERILAMAGGLRFMKAGRFDKRAALFDDRRHSRRAHRRAHHPVVAARCSAMGGGVRGGLCGHDDAAVGGFAAGGMKAMNGRELLATLKNPGTSELEPRTSTTVATLAGRCP